MNVKRIVVDRLPHSCSNCHYIRLHQPIISGEVFPYASGANRISKQIEGEVELYRPEWCPLEVEEVCEWRVVIEDQLKAENERLKTALRKIRAYLVASLHFKALDITEQALKEVKE